MSQATQQAIADRLGISRATVSRCFTNHAGISPVTRARVFQVAAEIGYTHMEARTPARRRALQGLEFNVLICSETEEYFRGAYESPGEQILAGVAEFAQTRKIRVDVHLIPPSASGLDDPAFQDVPGMSRRDGRGVLLIYPFPKIVIDQLALIFPLVSLVDQVEHNTIDCVDVDHYSGISSILEHLHASGHRRIGFYTRDYPVQASWSFRRYGAFVEKMSQLKLKVRAKDVIGVFPAPAVSVPESIREAAERTRSGVTAWVCAADHQAYDLIRGLGQSGLKVPRDVSVTGFDGIARATGSPLLTTVEIPYRAIGTTGAERLAARLRKRFSDKQHIYIAGQVRSGKTVAGPAR